MALARTVRVADGGGNLKTILLFVLLLSVRVDGSESKTRRMDDNHHRHLPIYDLYPHDQLPNDRQISALLYKGQTKTFHYASTLGQSSVPISVTISACTSPILLGITNGTTQTERDNRTAIIETIPTGMKTIRSLRGRRYRMDLTALKNDTYVHIYLSTEHGGPEALKSIEKFANNVKLIKRQRKKQLTVRWEPSLVDPQKTVYCLVVSSQTYYNSLCSAQTTINGRVPHKIKLMPSTASNQRLIDPSVYCVGSRTHHTLTELREGQTYYYNLFAIDGQSNFTYPHGRAMDVFDNNIKPIALRDGKSTYVNLKKYDGKAILRFKVGKRCGKTLELYLMPCGSAIDVEVSLRRRTVQMKRAVEGFGRIVVDGPKPGARYYVKILTSYKDEVTKQSGVELYCTTKPNSTLPLPVMPFQLSVKEYVSLRTCNSVTVGWYASPSSKLTRYCLVVKEGRLRERDGDYYRMPNQCGLENRLKKSADFAVKYCIDKKSLNEQVITQKISQLKPRKSYIVQVTAKKPKGKTLSYELLEVQTKPCGLANRNN